MRLSAARLRKVEEQLGIRAVPDEHPAVPTLKEAFGDHTFFLDAAGLNIVEPTPSEESEASESPNGNVVKLASWASEERTELQGHEPQLLPVTVELGSEDPDSAA